MKTKLFSLAVLASSLVSTQAWNIIGNSGTNSVTNFIGTSDANGLVFKTNNIERMNVDAVGKITLKQQSDLDLSFETFGRLQFNTDTTSDGMQVLILYGSVQHISLMIQVYSVFLLRLQLLIGRSLYFQYDQTEKFLWE